MRRLALTAIALLLSTPAFAQAVQQEPFYRLQLQSPILFTDSGSPSVPPETNDPTDPPDEPPVEQPTEPPVVLPLSIVTTGSSLRKNVPFSIPLIASGGTPGYAWSAEANGLGATVIDDDLLGTPMTNGTHSVPITVADSSGTPLSANLSFSVSSPVMAFSSPTTAAVLGQAFTIRPTYSGLLGTGTPRYRLTGAPTGVTISNSGVISGTLNQSGTFTASATVTDSDGSISPAQSFSIAVAQGTPYLNSYLVSVTGGTLQGLSSRNLVVTASPGSGQGIVMTPGTTVTAMFDRIVHADRLSYALRSIDSTCSSGGVGVKEYEWRIEITLDGTNWIVATTNKSTTATKICSNSGIMLPPGFQDYRGVRATLVKALRSDTGASTSMLLGRMAPSYE